MAKGLDAGERNLKPPRKDGGFASCTQISSIQAGESAPSDPGAIEIPRPISSFRRGFHFARLGGNHITTITGLFQTLSGFRWWRTA
ncbi:MAG: hypothetical protein LBJ46_00300 [Planctomycetota bacterium]|nr:hypothetical protein [Planctomycetota bacterium]